MVLGPVGRGGEPRAAVQVGWVSAAGLPYAGGGAELAVQADAFAVFFEPAAQGGPLADQDLVRDLGGALAERDQPRLGEPLQQRLDGFGRDAFGDELLDAWRAGATRPRRRPAR